jgi:hypothetical protein
MFKFIGKKIKGLFLSSLGIGKKILRDQITDILIPMIEKEIDRGTAGLKKRLRKTINNFLDKYLK